MRSSSGATPELPVLDALLDAGVRRDLPALAWSDGVLSYEDLAQGADRLAARLEALGDGLDGQRIAVAAPNVPALLVAMLAAWRVGACCVPLSARLREYELSRILEDAEPAALVAVPSHRGYSIRALAERLMPALPSLRGCLFVDERGDAVEELPSRVRPVEPEPLAVGIKAALYTSGSTGAAKGALITEDALTLGARELAERLALAPSEATVLVIPGSHAFGLACLLATLGSGGRCVLLDSTFSLKPLVEVIEANEARVLHGSPALFLSLLKAYPGGLSGIRTGLVGGASSPPGMIERLDATGARILNVFGMTELGPVTCCTLDDPPEVRYATAGAPLAGFELRTVPVSERETDLGEIQVRGPAVTPGYLGRPDLTGEAFEGDWFRTGDLGTIDPVGNLRVAGRAKELIQIAGFNVFPAEVESFLMTHTSVHQAAVVGVPHTSMGQVLAAFVVPRPGEALEPAELLRFARTQIAGYKLPYSIQVLSELPLLSSGKPDRTTLRERAIRDYAPAHKSA